jgi:hypothetical protein
MTPLRAVFSGVAAAALGTLAMDCLWYARYRRGGGSSPFVPWETARGLNQWEKAPVPAQVGRRLVEGFLQRPLPASRARLTTNVTHWAYGLGWGAVYGIVAGSTRSRHPLLGPPFGAAVFANDYVILPLGRFYKPIWEYDARTLWQDLSAHLVFGSVTGLAFRLLP